MAAAQEAFAKGYNDPATMLACLGAAIEAAAPLIVSHRETTTVAAITRAERERIRQLADQYEARRACLECGNYNDVVKGPCCPPSLWFADLIGGDT